MQGWCIKMLLAALNASCKLYLFLPSDFNIKVCLSFSEVWMLSWILSFCPQILCCPLDHNSNFFKHRGETQGFANLMSVPCVLILAAMERVAFHIPGHFFDMFCSGSQHSWEDAYLAVVNPFSLWKRICVFAVNTWW